MSCATTIDMCITRGAGFALDIGFSTGFEDVVAAPADYTVTVVWRRQQRDSSTPLLTVVIPIVAYPEAVLAEPKAIASLRLTATQTSGLPAADHVAYADVTHTASGDVRRLFNADVSIGD